MSFCGEPIGDKSLFWSHHERHNNQHGRSFSVVFSTITKLGHKKSVLKGKIENCGPFKTFFKSQILGSESYYDIDKVLDKKLK